MAISLKQSLKTCNTLALPADAECFAQLTDANELSALLDFAADKKLPVLVLGEGSNLVLRGDFSGLVVQMANRGVTFTDADDGVRVTANAGENWHELVMQCVARNLGGIENLALIPGTVGAAPVQNIGAYGVELAAVLDTVTVWDRKQRCWQEMSNADCQFGYRDSLFKHIDRFIIAAVTLLLRSNAIPKTHYAALKMQLERQAIASPTIQQVAEAVMAIRRSKLPDPKTLPNAGSFFKNPIISSEQFSRLQRDYPAVAHYPELDGRQKIAAAWLLDNAGWKGATDGDLAMHTEQALVMVNHGDANGQQVLSFAEKIQRDIQSRYGIALVIEPTVV